MQQPELEQIPTGMWTAGNFAAIHSDLAADLTDLFNEIDPVSLLDDVLNSPNPGDSAEAYEDLVTGDTDGGEW